MTKKLTSSIWLQKPIETPDLNLFRFLMIRPKFKTCSALAVCRDRKLTFSELISKSGEVARTLSFNGVHAGDIVPIFSEESLFSLVLFFALNRLGAISTFLNTAASPNEIEHHLKKFQNSLLLVSDTYAGRFASGKISVEYGKSIVIFPAHDCFDAVNNHNDPGTEYITWDEYQKRVDNQTGTVMLDQYGAKYPAHITYTSGTTGIPKSIMLTNENIMAEIIGLRRCTYMQVGPMRNSLQVVPFNYPYGFIVSTLFPMYAGKTVALTPGLTMKNIMEYLDMYKPAYINGIPQFYDQIMNQLRDTDYDLSFLKYPVSGGDTIDASAERKINSFLSDHGCKSKIMNGCGNGEACGSLLNPASVFEKYRPGSCGKQTPGLSTKLISDEDGKPVPIGCTGRFCFSGTNLMAGYYQESDETNSAIHIEDGIRWLYTDTYMHMDANGWMFMDGRDRRFFITFDGNGSPFKVYCDYVQTVINGLSDKIRACAVVSKKDPIRSLVPIAYISLWNDVPDTEWEEIKTEIVAKAKNELASYALPAEYLRIKEMPYSVAGKLDYQTLEKMVYVD